MNTKTPKVEQSTMGSYFTNHEKNRTIHFFTYLLNEWGLGGIS